MHARILVPEVMDQPDLDPAVHGRALDGLGRIHVVSRSVATLWPPLRELSSTSRGVPLRVLDLACGGGQVAIGLAQRARAEGADLEICGCDRSRVALDYARRHAARCGVRVGFHALDVVGEPLPAGFDVVCCTLFLHHLDEAAAFALLQKMARAARRAVLVADLRRTRLGHALAWAGCRLLTRSPVVHTDGTRSVRAAFTTAEIGRLAARAGLAGATVAEHWPQRFVLMWRRPHV